MSSPASSDIRDEVAALIARFTTNVSDHLEPRIERAAKAALVDSIAVAMGALTHPAAAAARRHGYRFPVGADGCLIWGSDKRTTPDKIEMKKFDPVARKHVIYKETKLK